MPDPSRQAADSTAPEDRVPLAEKLGYGLGTCVDLWGHWLYPNLANQVFNIYLGVSPALVSLALMINRLVSAVSDPFFGWLSDNARTRFGRRRPFILLGAVLAGFGLPLLFLVAPGWGATRLHCFGRLFEVSNYFWYMLGSSALFIPMMSCFNMPYQSLGAELTSDYHERTSVMAFKHALQKIAHVPMFFALQFTTLGFFVDSRTHQVNLLFGAQIYCAILGLAMVIAGGAVFLVARERLYTSVVARQSRRVRLRESIYATLVCGPFRIQLALRLAYSVGTSMVGTFGYYNTVYYVCRGDLATATRWNTLMGISAMCFGLLGIPIFGAVARRFGKRMALSSVLGTAMVSYFCTWALYNPNWPSLQLIASGSIALASAGYWMLDGSIGADIMDYDELEGGTRREGAFSACGSWVTKVGIAAGMGASGFILAATGFDSKLGGAQTAHTLQMIRLFLAGVPIVGLACALLVLSRYALTQQRMVEIRTQLEQRRGKV